MTENNTPAHPASGEGEAIQALQAVPTMFPQAPAEHLPLPLASLQRLALAAQRIKESAIVSDQDASVVTDFWTVLNSGVKMLEDKRKAQVEEMTKRTAAINKFFRGFRRPLEEAMNLATGKINDFRREQRRFAEEQAAREHKEAEDRRLAEAARQEKEAQEAQEQAAALENEGRTVEAQAALDVAQVKEAQAQHALNEAADLPMAPVMTGPTKFRGAFGRTSHEKVFWNYEVKDFDQIPREWLALDVERVKESINRKENPARQIPGLRIFEDVKSSMR